MSTPSSYVSTLLMSLGLWNGRLTTSGAMYCSVPRRDAGRSSRTLMASPKSQTLMDSSRAIRMFSGLMSLGQRAREFATGASSVRAQNTGGKRAEASTFGFDQREMESLGTRRVKEDQLAPQGLVSDRAFGRASNGVQRLVTRISEHQLRR